MLCEGRKACLNEAAPGRLRCAACLRRERERQAARRVARRKEGICTDCDAPVVPGRSMCAHHLAENVAEVLAYQESALAAGLCRQCLHRPLATTRYCAVCIKARRERKARERAENVCTLCGVRGHYPNNHGALGLCPRCDAPRSERSTGECDACWEKERVRVREEENAFVSLGLCRRCKKKPVAKRSTSRCESCLERAAAHERGKRRREAA
jgi:hypothetical protein